MDEIDQAKVMATPPLLQEGHQDGCSAASDLAVCLDVDGLENLMGLVSELSRLATECQTLFNSAKK